MTYTINVLRTPKTGDPHLHKLTEILADGYTVRKDPKEYVLVPPQGTVEFYNEDCGWFGRKKRRVIATLPPGEWVIL